MLSVDHASLVNLISALYGQGDYATRAKESVKALGAMTGARGGVVFRFKAGYDDGTFRIRAATDLRMIGRGPRRRENAAALVRDAPAAEAAFGRTHGSTFSEIAGAPQGCAHIPIWRESWNDPVIDSLGLISLDAAGSGLVLSVGLERPWSTTPREQRLLARLATHLGAADRLDATPRHSSRTDEADAVLSPSAKVLHARPGVALGALRDGVDRVRFAKRCRNDAEKALEVWQGLAAGRWSIVDHTDTDGKRFVLAMRNVPEPDPREGLTPGQRRVAALVAMGHRDKEIAYMLGTSPDAVSGAMRRIRRTRNVHTRAQVAALWRRGARREMLEG
jgi:DNA-binding CsgD family transcriptional regulator